MRPIEGDSCKMSLDIVLPTSLESSFSDDQQIGNINDFLVRIETDSNTREVIFFDESMTGFIVFKGRKLESFLYI